MPCGTKSFRKVSRKLAFGWARTLVNRPLKSSAAEADPVAPMASATAATAAPSVYLNRMPHQLPATAIAATAGS
jgi:hypothetical protein